MKNWWVIPIICVVIAGIVAITYYSGYRRGKKAVESTIVERVDTLVIRDTTKVTEPKYITRRVVDSILVPVVDTVRLTDTLYIFLEREQIRWEDSLSVVYASGYKPQVDSVIHYTENLVITKEKVVYKTKKTHWGIGVQVGAGVGINGKFTPYAGVGVSYNIFAW